MVLEFHTSYVSCSVTESLGWQGGIKMEKLSYSTTNETSLGVALLMREDYKGENCYKLVSNLLKAF